MSILVYKTFEGIIASRDNQNYLLPDTDWDGFINRDDVLEQVTQQLDGLESIGSGIPEKVLAPIGTQEVWAAGVTYFKSREARMEESQDAGGGDFYDRVYSADRPELFAKATAHRVSAPGEFIRIRKDSTWDVPEPELTLCMTSSGKIVGYTAGNDVSSRSIEGENPLYLPQAKTYDKCAALGPAILLCDAFDLSAQTIGLAIDRGGERIFDESISLSSLKRTPEELAEFLYRESSFPTGSFLMTGTGIVPDHPFTLTPGDVVHISISGIGVLSNPVE